MYIRFLLYCSFTLSMGKPLDVGILEEVKVTAKSTATKSAEPSSEPIAAELASLQLDVEALAGVFLNEKLDSTAKNLGATISWFVKRTNDELERVKGVQGEWDETKLGNLSGDKVRALIDRDIADAERFIPVYRRMWSSLDTNIGLLASNYNLQTFVAEMRRKGVSEATVQEVSAVLQNSELESELFKKLMDRLRGLRNDVEFLLSGFLEPQVEKLRELKIQTFAEMLDTGELLRKRVQWADNFYWKTFRFHLNMLKEDKTEFRAKYLTEKDRLATVGRRYAWGVKTKVAKEREAYRARMQVIKSPIRRTLVRALYALGMYKFLMDLDKLIFMKVWSAAEQKLINQEEREVLKDMGVLEGGGKDIIASLFTD